MDNEFIKPNTNEDSNTHNYYGGGVPDTGNYAPQTPYGNQPYPSPAYQQPGFPAQHSNPYAAQHGYPANYGAVPQPTPTNKNALISLITALVCMFFLNAVPVLGTAGSIVGVVFGHKALNETPDAPGSGRGMALAGIIIGYVSVVSSIAILGLYALVFLGAIASASGY